MRKLILRNAELPIIESGYYSITELFGNSYFSKRTDSSIKIKPFSIVGSIIIDKPIVLVIPYKRKLNKYVITITYQLSDLAISRMEFLDMIRMGKCILDKRISKKVTKILDGYISKMTSADPKILSDIIKYPIEAYLDSLGISTRLVKVD